MKRQKRYNPRKHRAYSNTAPYAAAVEAIRTGTCTEAQFWQLIENHYLYIHLLGVLRGLDKYSDNPETDMLARLEIQTACEDALNKTTQIIDAIGERKKQHGRFIATGPELTHLTQGCEKFKAMLGIANYSHYMQAFKNSEPVISDIAYRHNKRIKQEQAK